MHILKELRASRFVNADSKGFIVTGLSSRDDWILAGGVNLVSKREELVHIWQFS
jgi:hypothetical protein